ncbi:MAG: helix-hairpin-helix domain-containing protein [Acidobacteria bacterium]|nr:helix-hairpin-helix domain-containing protein [Acidobacteriota bacterium]
MQVKKIAGCLVILCLFFAVAGGAFAENEDKLNLNAATVEELAKIPGLNPDLAAKIIELREENGEYIDMEELLDIPGIDNKLLRQLKKHLFIESVDDCNC